MLRGLYNAVGAEPDADAHRQPALLRRRRAGPTPFARPRRPGRHPSAPGRPAHDPGAAPVRLDAAKVGRSAAPRKPRPAAQSAAPRGPPRPVAAGTRPGAGPARLV